MPILALVLIAGWLTVAVVARGAIQAQRSSTPSLRLRDHPGSAQWWARLLGSLGFVLLVAAPIASLAGLPASPVLDGPGFATLGVVLTVGGTIVTVLGQVAMGVSWRGDVDPDARLPLVTDGPFRWVRNPILSATAVTTIGIALLVPNLLAALAIAAVLASHQILVRMVEEPYLERVHGAVYRDYAARTGRFVPGIGRRLPSGDGSR